MSGLRYILACCAAGLLACSDGGLSLSEFITATSDAACDKMFECCTAEEITQQFGNEITPDQCRAFIGGLATSLALPQWQAAIDAGRLVYHEDRAQHCLDLARSSSCSDYSGGVAATDIPGCEPWLEGQVADGGACGNDDECLSGFCVGNTMDELGVCEVLPTEGQPCTFDCADGLYCESGECKPKKANSEDCITDSQCQSDYCDDTSDQCATEPPSCTGA